MCARVLPVEVGLEQRELSGDLDGVQGHEVKVVSVSWFADVPFDWWRRVLERDDAGTRPAHLHLLLPLDDLGDRLHPLPHCFTYGGGACVDRITCLLSKDVRLIFEFEF